MDDEIHMHVLIQRKVSSLIYKKLKEISYFAMVPIFILIQFAYIYCKMIIQYFIFLSKIFIIHPH